MFTFEDMAFGIKEAFKEGCLQYAHTNVWEIDWANSIAKTRYDLLMELHEAANVLHSEI